MKDPRLLQFFLCFAGVVACVATVSAIAYASTSASTDSSAARPDSVSTARADSVSTARPGSVSAARADSVTAVPPDSTSGALPDSVARNAKSPQSVLPDTLQFLPPPGSQTGGTKPGEGTGTTAAGAPKERTGIWGIAPIAILLSIAVLHYFIIKAVSN